MALFIDISSDVIYASNLENTLEYFSLPRNGIEKVLGAQLIKQYAQQPFQEIYVLNGP